MKIDGVIFDMDGVLVDVSQSYRVAIEKTANFFLGRSDLSIKVTQEEVMMIKNLPGFNNDWDATYVLIVLLSKGVKKDKFSNAIKNLPAINKKTKEYKKIQKTFQTFYQRLNSKEKCLISKELLARLINMNLKLGIATGRPRKEALHAINNFNLQTFFPEYYIVALEDTAKEKPLPDSLLEVKKRMQVEKPIYIGDTISDVIAAKKAKMPCVFIGDGSFGDFQITNVNKLEEVLL